MMHGSIFGQTVTESPEPRRSQTKSGACPGMRSAAEHIKVGGAFCPLSTLLGRHRPIADIGRYCFCEIAQFASRNSRVRLLILVDDTGIPSSPRSRSST